MRVRDERGIALASAMLLMVVIMTGVGVAASRGAHLARGTLQARGDLAALYAAEAGLAKARLALAGGGNAARADLRVGGCEVVVSARRIRSGQWEITARATSHPRGRGGSPVVVILREGYGDVTWFSRGPAR